MLEIRNLRVRYPGGNPADVFPSLSLCLKRGELLWIKGANGSGKTTLLYAASNIIPQMINAQREGEIYLDGGSITQIPLNRMIPALAVCLSNPLWQFFFSATEDEIIYAPENLGMAAADIGAKLHSALMDFQLSERRGANPHQLSYGWQRLVNHAVWDAVSPQVLLLDEPLCGLSDANVQMVLAWLENLKASGKIVLAAEHDDRISALATHVLDLSQPEKG